MALTKEQKQSIVEEVSSALQSSKMTTFAKYQGTSVKSLQQLRASGKDAGTTIKVIKNRLVLKAIESNDRFKDVDKQLFSGMLIYAFNDKDEVASAQTLFSFTKQEPTIEILGAITEDGELISAEDTKSLASLPSRDVLRAQLVAVIAAPISSFSSLLNAQLRSIINVLNSRAESIVN